MGDVYTTGVWHPNAGEEGAFIEAWSAFAGWASTMPGAGALRLTRDIGDPQRFVSFGVWSSIEAVHAWKSSLEFAERIGRVKEHVSALTPTELEVVAALEGGRPTS
jgi:heme-degrading monooxygenase HmoA